MRYLLKYPLFALMLIASSSVFGADLRVEISKADPANGPVYFALFDSEAGFNARERSGQAVSRSWEDRPSAVFTDLPPGDYAVSVFQDSNNNQKLDTNLLGIPTEPYGFSRNAMGNMGPPGFAAAAITLPENSEELVIDIQLRMLP